MGQLVVITLNLTGQQVAIVLQALMEVPAQYKVVAPVIDAINAQVRDQIDKPEPADGA